MSQTFEIELSIDGRSTHCLKQGYGCPHLYISELTETHIWRQLNSSGLFSFFVIYPHQLFLVQHQAWMLQRKEGCLGSCTHTYPIGLLAAALCCEMYVNTCNDPVLCSLPAWCRLYCAFRSCNRCPACLWWRHRWTNPSIKIVNGLTCSYVRGPLDRTSFCILPYRGISKFPGSIDQQRRDIFLLFSQLKVRLLT